MHAQEADAPAISANPLNRESGDQRASFYLALTVPLANQSFSGENFDHMWTLGGALGGTWGIYITPLLFAGAGVQLFIAASEIGTPIYNFSLFAEVGISPQLGPVEFPVTFGLGLNNMTYKELYKTDFMIRSSAAVMWNFTSRWAIGASAAYTLIVQSYFGPNPPPEDSRLHHQIAPAIMASITF